MSRTYMKAEHGMGGGGAPSTVTAPKPKQPTGRGGIFGQQVTIFRKNVGKNPIPGQGETPETIDPTLSRQQRRLAARKGKL